MNAGTLGRAAIAIAAFGFAGCSLVLDFSDRADAGFANPRCETDEPNDVGDNTAPMLDQGTSELALCGNADVDFFTITVADGEDVVLMTSSPDGLELELALLMGANAVQVSNATGADELIERTAALGNQLDAGQYFVRVQSSPPGEGSYDLVLAISAPGDAGPDGS